VQHDVQKATNSLTANIGATRSRLVRSPERIRRTIGELSTNTAREKERLGSALKSFRDLGARLELIVQSDQVRVLNAQFAPLSATTDSIAYASTACHRTSRVYLSLSSRPRRSARRSRTEPPAKLGSTPACERLRLSASRARPGSSS
jgi:hypothetical protein